MESGHPACIFFFFALHSNLQPSIFMKKRSFSFLLAWRYLNPRRSMLSSFSIISVLGVMLGVLVLVVVMAIYAGLERNVKSRILGFTPHALLSQGGAMADWQDAAAKAKSLPTVEAANAYIADNVIVDVESLQKPVLFHGVDSSDPVQIEGIRKMLDFKHHPESSADLGLDDRVVISSALFDSFASSGFPIQIGEKIRLYSTRNFEGVMKAYKATEKPPIREAFSETWRKSTEALTAAWQPDGSVFTLPFAIHRAAYDELGKIYDQPDIREPEKDLLGTILNSMDTAEKDDAVQVFRFTAEAKTALETAISELNTTDQEKMDSQTFKGLKTIVLPKEATVIGVYQASQMAVTPDLFVPLHLAQSLAGLDNAVQGISLRLKDPYSAEIFAENARKTLGEDWSLTTWGDQYRAFFSLIEQQRGMMYFTLSFIVLISAFSMMAVMFTVTLQKRREIGVMKALGAAPNQIVRVFLYQGMILGTVGAILGIGLGQLVLYFRGSIQAALRTVGFDPFSSSLTGFDVLPAYSDPAEQVIFALMAFVLCSLAALVPAFFAARSDAAKSLRNL